MRLPVIESFRLTAAALVLCLLGAAAFAQPRSEELIIEGQVVEASAQSIKCELGEKPGVSKKRLVDCNSAELVDLSVHGGDMYAIQFQISPKDKKISEGVRAELRDMHESHNGDVDWYRFSTLLPREFPLQSPHRLVLSQWHERIHEGGKSLRPPLSHRLWNGRFVVTLWNADRIAERGMEGDGEILFELPQLELGRFYEFVYKIRWSGDDDGEITAWVRTCPVIDFTCPGSLWSNVINYDGQTGYPDSQIESYYFKLGLYTVTDFAETMTAYHRDYQRGTSAAEIGLTDPMFR